MNATRSTDAHFYGLFGGSSEHGDNDGTLANKVVGNSGVVIVAAPRPVYGETSNPPVGVSPVPPATPLQTRGGFSHLALLADANNGSINTVGGDKLKRDARDIVWNSDVNISAGPAPELVVDADGHGQAGSATEYKAAPRA